MSSNFWIEMSDMMMKLSYANARNVIFEFFAGLLRLPFFGFFNSKGLCRFNTFKKTIFFSWSLTGKICKWHGPCFALVGGGNAIDSMQLRIACHCHHCTLADWPWRFSGELEKKEAFISFRAF